MSILEDNIRTFAKQLINNLSYRLLITGNGTGGENNRISCANGNFTVAVFMPYGGVQTDFTLEFFCEDGMKCGEEKVACLDDDPSCTGVVDTTQVNLKGLQIAIDSTGRANDLFRRVDTRLEGSDDFSFSIMGPLELFGEKNSNESGNDTLKKDYAVTCEYNFDPKTCN